MSVKTQFPHVSFTVETTYGVPADGKRIVQHPIKFRETATLLAYGMGKQHLLNKIARQRRNARRNMQRQKAREEDGRKVRVRFTFWEQALRDLDRAERYVRKANPKSTFTLEATRPLSSRRTAVLFSHHDT